MKPVRIQRQRTKDWRMPENTVYVGRGTEWGNPFKVGTVWQGRFVTQEVAVELYAERVEHKLAPLHDVKSNAWKLRGKNLACWCGVGDICHADILLKLANGDDDAKSKNDHFGRNGDG